MNEYDESIVKEFLIESYENLEQIERDLVALEKNPISQELLAGIYRSIHTIKGSSSFLSLSKLEAIAHSGESLLSHLRDGRLILNSEITNALLALVDTIRKILLSIETQHNEGEADYAQMLKVLARLQEEGTPVGELPTPSSETVSEAKVDTLSIFESKIRIDVRLLNNLMDLAGELVLARNQILQFAATQEDRAFIAVTQRLNLITSELQEEVMKTRMRPISTVWNRYPRMVRDLATTRSKQVRIEMRGTETGLDRSVIEAIADPLTHLVRNAIDHGLETPEERLAAGKPAEGRLFLQAFHEGGQVNIEISDNGRGIDPERIKQKAHQSGLITADQLINMSNQEILNLIFLPGFSTAKEVTHISGRGVGMDVVKTNIDKIGGIVDVQSKLGQGTTIKIKIPLTLAIIPALIVACGGSRYAVPQVSLLELVRLEGAQARKCIELVQEAPVYRLRGKLLPLIYLKHELQVDEEILPANARKLTEDVVNIVVLQADNHEFGLIVDAIKDTQEIVVKPLGKQVKGIACFSGATIMGDGKVALILDVLNLAHRAHVISASAEAEQALVEQSGQTEQHLDDRQMLLLFRCAKMGRAAIPLAMVTRLEKFDCAAIERSGDQDMVQYRDQLLPLINLSTLFAQSHPGLDGEGTNGPVAKNGTIQVVVYSTRNRNIGLVVEHILDIVQERLEVKYPASRDDILFISVIQGQVTQVLDVERIVRSAVPTFFEEPLAT